MDMQEGEATRILIVGGGKLGSAKISETIKSLRAMAPLVDVLAWRPAASGDWVRAALAAGAADVVLDDHTASVVTAAVELLARQRLLPQVEELSEARLGHGRFDGMLSRNVAMWELFTTVTRTAKSDASVLITGDTGTGKELLARSIHRHSERSGRFVAVNCSSIRPEMVEAELFGHEQGAFTGAVQARDGHFRYAEGGTLFLDEIGDMSPEAQLSLLRVLQEGKIRPVGASREIDVDARIVAATNASLAEAVRDGDFREDLYYRLDVIRLRIPPLRERPEDVLYLFGHFLRSRCKRYGVRRPHLEQGFIDRLVAHDWPGNVRQLENLVERLVLAGDRESLREQDLESLLVHTQGPSAKVATATPRNRIRLDTQKSLAENLEPLIDSVEKRYLDAVLAETGGRVIDTAERAGVNRRTLSRKMSKYGLDKAAHRTPREPEGDAS